MYVLCMSCDRTMTRMRQCCYGYKVGREAPPCLGCLWKMDLSEWIKMATVSFLFKISSTMMMK